MDNYTACSVSDSNCCSSPVFRLSSSDYTGTLHSKPSGL